MELIDTVDLDKSINSIAGLVDHIGLTTIYVVVHAGGGIDPDRRQNLQHVQPVVRHLPTPLIGVKIVRNHITEVIQQDAGKRFSYRKRNLSKLYSPVITKLNLHTNPMSTRLTVPFSRLIIDTHNHLTLRTTDLNSRALGR